MAGGSESADPERVDTLSVEFLVFTAARSGEGTTP